MAKKSEESVWKKFCGDILQGSGKRTSSQCDVASRECLWMDTCYNPSRAAQVLTQRELVHAHLRDASHFLALLDICGRNKDLCRGSILHDDIVQSGLLEKCSDGLVCMYARCGSLSKARRLFAMYRSKDVVTWTALIAGCAQKGQGHDALSFLQQMQHEGVSPNSVTFACALKACGIVRALEKGEKIHDEIIKQGLLKNNIVLGTALVRMYAKCGALAKARELLEALPVRDVVSWNVLITGYVEHGEFEQALYCFEQLQHECLSPSSVTFACILKACGSMGAAHKGKEIHDEIIKQRLLDNNIVLGTALVGMYAKCGVLTRAWKMLEELPVRDTVAWTALIGGYSQHGQGAQALSSFEQMELEGVSPNAVTFASILKACGDMGEVCRGEKIHDEITKQGLFINDIVLGTALVDMYFNFAAFAKAQQVLRKLQVKDVISWNAIITGYVDHGESVQALNCFWQMQRESVSPNAVSFGCALKACGNMGAVDEGKKIHDEIAIQGLVRSDVMLGTALVDMYAKCGALVKARQVLKQLPIRDVVSWTALIAGYVEHGEGTHALNCFEQMQHEHLFPNAVTLTNLLKACSTTGALVKGEKIHDEITKQGLLAENIDLGMALVDMYAKHGDFIKARQILVELPFRNVSCWNALMTGFIQHGECVQALNCLEEIQREGLSPDGATFVCVLSACGCLGLIQDAQTYFMKMSTKFGFNPDLRHYTCMVALLGRVGQLDKAVRVIETERTICSGVSFDSGVWSALLSACQSWGDVNVGRWAFENTLVCCPASQRWEHN